MVLIRTFTGLPPYLSLTSSKGGGSDCKCVNSCKGLENEKKDDFKIYVGYL